MNGTVYITGVIVITNSLTPSVAFSIRKGKWGNQHTFPDIVYIDTNIVLDILFNRDYKGLIEDYWEELVGKRSGMITWSPHTVNEMMDVIHVNKYVEYANNEGINDQVSSTGKIIKPAWKVAEDITPTNDATTISQEVIKDTNLVISNISQYGMELDITEEKATNIAKVIYQNYGGSIKDAKHVAYATLNGINCIQSNDAGFLRYPGLNIYGASKNLIKNANSNQMPVDYIELTNME